MEEKKYVCVVTTGVVGVDDREEVGRFKDPSTAIVFESMYLGILIREARIESQQVHYRNTDEFTQYDIQIEKILVDEDGEYLDSHIIVEESTPKFRYGEIVDEIVD